MKTITASSAPEGAERDVQRGQSPATPRVSVLLVDDQPARLLTYEAVLSGLDLRCVRALSATEALQHLLDEEFAVILLDVHMPQIDGFELARMIREHPRLERMPIIFVTGVHVSELDRLRGYEVGAIDYVSIPIVPEILRAKVAVLVELHLKRSELRALNRELEEMHSRVELEHRRVLCEKESELAAERSRTAAALRAHDRYNRALIEDAPVAIAHCTLEGTFEGVNKAFCDLLGYTSEELRALRWQDITHPDDRQLDSHLAKEVLAGRLPHYTVQKRYVRKDGSIVWVNMFGNFLRDDSGAAALGVAIAIDITEHKRSEERMRESEARFRELADAMPQIVFTARGDGITDYFNRQWYEMTGLPPGSTADDVWSSRLHPEDRERTLKRWYDSVRTGEPYQIEYRFEFPEHGGYRWHLTRALPVRNQAGEVTRWYGTCTDIHDFRVAQEALRQADRRKDEFLATLAHELRNPLAPIRSAVQFLRLHSPNDPRLAHASTIIERQTGVMVRLVDDLLDLSRITRGRITLQRSPLAIQDVLATAIDSSRTMIEANRHDLVVSAPDEPILVHGDSTRLAQIFSNLLNNAAKYTPSMGRIETTVSRQGHEALITVRDNGVGIPPDMLESIFKMFTQLGASIDRSQGGLGIGLTLARQLTEMHGGRIEARSAGVGHGSEFLIRLPIIDHADEPASAEPAVSSSRAQRRVLLADDNVDAAKMLSYLLELSGFEVRTACDGPEALKSFGEYRPEVVLLDIGMPGMSGYEVATAIRSLPRGERVLLIALTGWGQDSDRRMALAAGFDQHLTKPVDFDLLLATIENATAPCGQGESRA